MKPARISAGFFTLPAAASPRKFGWYLARQIERASRLYRSESLFINAWNEWAEGAYLEPDRHHGYQYLNAVKNALEAFRGLYRPQISSPAL
ncbi:glycoside hydrolase family 99-like domain-containing protein [Paenibacillus rhizosphaerae]|uniref:glycoside hydrolase family 99-like domain-containing protein n=1 Tax=Paenibacillus rhizosphaerae TaxID=297318 RepID=UPI0016219AB0